MRTCSNCPRQFVPPIRNPKQAYCSPRCSREQASDRARAQHRRAREARAARAVAVIGGPWLQLERGDCTGCSALDVWLYAPLVSPESAVCCACAQGQVAAGLLRRAG